MIYAIRWTSEAESSFAQNLDYLENEWDDKTLDRFLDRVETVIGNIEDNPFLYPLYSNEYDIRKCVINERIILFYRIIEGNSIDLVTFWNTWQNTKKMKF